ncbi:MAG: hypothetical protein K0M39_12660 [Rhizobium sp.]|nr:hypothetical protein [Rhizobium sp.]
MSKKACMACGMLFVPRPQIHNQLFCSNPRCQHERRRRRQAEKRASNPDRRANDALYYKDWLTKHPDYWKNYRASHPEYAERNRVQQRQRNKDRKNVEIAKDAV